MIDHSINKLQKTIRAKVIKRHLTDSELEHKVVCFSCGNASKALKEIGLYVHEVINPDKWWALNEIQKEFKIFDATSGHLPIPLMNEIAYGLKKKIKPNYKSVLQLPTGSGETFVCLKLAFPQIRIKPLYNLGVSTQYNENAPLNELVNILKTL